MTNSARRDEALATSDDGQTVYLALWSIAFNDAREAVQKAVPLLGDALVVRRYAALHLLGELSLSEARPFILSALDDPDLRIAQKAFDEGNWYADSEKPLPNDDRFERLERNIPRFPAQPQELTPVIWEWDKQTVHAENTVAALCNVLGTHPIERLFPYLPQMGSYSRASVARLLGEHKQKNDAMRTVLLSLAGDTTAYVRDSAFTALKKFALADDDAPQIESLLTRKAADLRKSALSLLLTQPDEKALQSGERLTGAKNINQRTAGLDLLTQMVEKKRKPVEARSLAVALCPNPRKQFDGRPKSPCWNP